MVEHGPHISQGLWTSEEAKSRSTWRELIAVCAVLEAFARMWPIFCKLVAKSHYCN